MQTIDIGIIILVAIGALALVLFLVMKNRKDRKKLWPTQGTDGPMVTDKMDEHRERSKL